MIILNIQCLKFGILRPFRVRKRKTNLLNLLTPRKNLDLLVEVEQRDQVEAEPRDHPVIEVMLLNPLMKTKLQVQLLKSKLPGLLLKMKSRSLL